MKIFKEQTINCAPQKALDYIANVQNHPAFISSLKSIDNLKGDPKQPGAVWNWSYIMGGVQIIGNAQTAEYEEGKRFVYKTTSGLQSTFTYEVAPDGEGTRLSITVEYDAPQSVLAKISDKAVIERLNQNEAEQAGENLKAILES